MRHIFILNPMAGNGKKLDELRAKVDLLPNAELYETREPHDATDYVSSLCEAAGEELRFYACGGDGTVKEVAEGIIGHPHASMSVCPIGSGNDLVKYFGTAEDFLDLDAIMQAESADMDVIHVTTEEGVDAYSVNVCNFGFEAYVAEMMGRVRRTPVLGGKNAYTTGIVAGLFSAMKTEGDIYVDGELFNKKSVFLLGSVANGGYVGGGYHCAPRASVTDGELEVCVVKPISLATLARLIGVYKEGGHLDDPRFAKYIHYTRAKKVEVKAQKPFAICLDGEIIKTKHFVAEVEQGMLRFAAPKVKTPEEAPV